MNVGLDAQSRFFRETDERMDDMIYRLPDSWWSRPYEYAWGASFVTGTEVALDAACGISHPFKFYLADHCRHTYACDWDSRILSHDAILAEVSADIGPGAERAVADRLGRLTFAQADITSLPYGRNFFDLVFCLSVLEHLPQGDMVRALREFERTLKPEGILVLTLDYPAVDLQMLEEAIADAGLEHVSGVDNQLFDDAVRTDMWGRIYCFRAALRKKDS